MTESTPRHKYEDGQQTKCRLCGLRWGNPVHRPRRGQHGSVQTVRAMLRHAVVLGLSNSPDFYNAAGPDAAALLEHLVDQALAISEESR